MNANFKTGKFASDKWRKSAQGKPCALRLDCCNHNTETTVLCHIRKFGWAGTGQKPPDFLAVYACSSCHDALDSRSADAPIGYDDILRALGETLMTHFAEGRIKP